MVEVKKKTSTFCFSYGNIPRYNDMSKNAMVLSWQFFVSVLLQKRTEAILVSDGNTMVL